MFAETIDGHVCFYLYRHAHTHTHTHTHTFSSCSELDLRPFTVDPTNTLQNTHYRLCGVVVHSGVSTSSGHYYSFLRVRDPESAAKGLTLGAWYRFDDQRVSQGAEDDSGDEML